MARKFDKELLIGFVEEARGYLPTILDGVRSFRGDPDRAEDLKEAHRLAHIIKGASSMVGLSTLSHAAYLVEEAIEDVANGALEMTPPVEATLLNAVSHIESYLDGVVADDPPDRSMATGIATAFRRLRGLPEAGDAEAIEQILGASRGAAAEPPVRLDEHAPAPEEDREEISSELRAGFLVEAEDHLRTIAGSLGRMEKEPGNKSLLLEVRRAVHTLKGAAGLVGFGNVTQLAHRMEDLLDALNDGECPSSEETQSLLFATADALEDLLDPGAGVPPEALAGLYARYTQLLGASSSGLPDLGSLGEERSIEVAEAVARGQVTSGPSSAGREAVRPEEIVRVPLERLDELVRLVSELVINRSTFEQHNRRLRGELDELGPGIGRLRRVSTKLETEYEARALGGLVGAAGGSGVSAAPGSIHSFDELEFDRYTEFHLLARELAETTSDLTAAGGDLTDFARDFESSLTRQGHLTSEIQDRLIRLRMVPLATIATRLMRAVRVTAQQQGKDVDLEIEGEEVELDKTVLEQIADPLLHLLRNAVDHGVEPAALRRVTGKPGRAKVVLRALHEATQVVLEVSDDGAGLDPEILRSAAVRGGWVPESEAAGMKEEDLFSLVFLPGFSTAGEVSEISGRGVGMDIVRSAVHRLKGTVSIRSDPGRGTTVTIRLPMTLAIARVLLVRAGDQTFAVPLAAILQILRLEPESLAQVGEDTLLRLQGEVYPFARLSSLLGRGSAAPAAGGRVPVLIVAAAGRKIAWAVDELLEQREVVVKTLGSLLRRVKGITGATLMGDGTVVLILNPNDLAETERRRPLSIIQEKRAVARRAPLDILIVDDSSSVRRILSNLVRSAGWNPWTARDGLEALETILRAPKKPDLILLDIEMPRMDGYELAASLRSEAEYRDIPIVVVTSRAGEKHRRKAAEVGLNDYVVKPYRDEALLDMIRTRTREGAQPS